MAEESGRDLYFRHGKRRASSSGWRQSSVPLVHFLFLLPGSGWNTAVTPSPYRACPPTPSPDRPGIRPGIQYLHQWDRSVKMMSSQLGRQRSGLCIFSLNGRKKKTRVHARHAHILINHFSLFKSAWGSYAMNNTGEKKKQKTKTYKTVTKKAREVKRWDPVNSNCTWHWRRWWKEEGKNKIK